MSRQLKNRAAKKEKTQDTRVMRRTGRQHMQKLMPFLGRLEDLTAAHEEGRRALEEQIEQQETMRRRDTLWA